MDDVLDNIRFIHDGGGIYRYVSLLVSDLRHFGRNYLGASRKSSHLVIQQIFFYPAVFLSTQASVLL